MSNYTKEGDGGIGLVVSFVRFRAFGNVARPRSLISPFLQYYQRPLSLLRFGNEVAKLIISIIFTMLKKFQCHIMLQ